MMDDETKQQLINNISKAWEEVLYPGDNNIFTTNSYDDEGITDYFKGTTWLGHKPEELRAYDLAINVFFTKEAYHYWLPAFLIASIENPNELSQGVDALINSFIPSTEKLRRSEHLSRMALLSNEQKLVIINVLEYLTEKYFDSNYPGVITEEILALKYLYENTSTV